MILDGILLFHCEIFLPIFESLNKNYGYQLTLVKNIQRKITLIQVNNFLICYFLLIFLNRNSFFLFVIFIAQSFMKIKVLCKILMMF